MHILVDFFCWIAVAALIYEMPASRAAHRFALGASVLVFCLTHSYLAIKVLGTRTEPDAEYAAARSRLQAASNIGLDEVAARFVYDYRLPPHAYYWNFSGPPPRNCPSSTAQKPPTTTWVLSTVKSGLTQGLPVPQPIRFLGHQFRSLPARPYQVVVVK